MKNNLKLLLLILTLNFSCSSDDNDQELITVEEIKNKINFKINGLPSNNRISGLSATLCCEKKLSISFDNFFDLENGSYYGGSGLHLDLDINGNLLSIWYKTYGPNSEYYSPFFSPTSTLNVTEFEFVENQILKLKINGHIFKKTYNFFAAPEFINIDADIEIKKFHQCTCGSFFSKITNDNDFVFHRFTRRSQTGNNIRYFAYANNGYHIEFLNFNEFIQNMPLGIYEFDENTTSHRIDFRKFVGVPRAFMSEVIPQEWLKYETSGSFEIMERQQIGNDLVTKVKFDLIAKDNNEVIFEFNDAILETQM